ncbi:hypothetical protein [Actinopolymorpha pittospori]
MTRPVDVPDTDPGFERLRTPDKAGRLLLAPSFLRTRFDALAVDCPFVFRRDGRAHMTYVGWDGVGYQTGLASSDDLVHWQPEGVIFGRDDRDDLRRHNAAMTSILRDNDLFGSGELIAQDSRYLATWHAYPDAGYETGPGVIGFAASPDLRSWEPVGGLLRPGEGGAWDAGGLYKSWLLRHDGLYYVFYNAKNQTTGSWREQTGVAVSEDLVNWTRPVDGPVLRNGGPGDFDERFASDPCVLRWGDRWVMFYFGLAADGHARDGWAWSTDLLTWTKGGTVLLDVGPQGSIDSLHAHKPAVLADDAGRLHHFYCAVARREPVRVGDHEQREMRGISVATSRLS